jgi:hypothetical protein
LAALVSAQGALAHEADIIYAHIEKPIGGVFEETLTLSPESLLLLAPIDASGDGELTNDELERGKPAIDAGIWDGVPVKVGNQYCARTQTSLVRRRDKISLKAQFNCQNGERLQTFKILSVLPQGYRVILGSENHSGGVRFAEGNAQTLVLPDEALPRSPEKLRAAVEGLGGWFRLGVFHIFTGFDHLAFLLALLLVGGSWRKILWMVTAFTLAHSLTLGVSAFGLLTLGAEGERWVEVAIAASIIYVALENLILKQHAHRAAITFGFGLVHGFGFASVLKGYGLGDSAWVGLLGFNLGVESGQGVVVACLFPLARLLQKRPESHVWVLRSFSALLVALGGYWMVDRLLG